MPVPKPNEGEKQNQFMGRCMKFMHDENQNKSDKNKRGQQQMVAICFSQWRGMHGGKPPQASAAEDKKGPALKVDKSKGSVSTKAWGSVDKTSLRNKILGASNAGSLVHDVYLLVESGWESAPSEHLKYPVMEAKGDTLVYNRGGLGAALQRAEAQNETGVVSKIHGIYKKLGIS